MGGHGAFIWPAYIIAAIVLTALLFISIADTRRQERVLKQLRVARRSARNDTETETGNAP